MKTLDTFDFGRSVGRSSYDWDAILNGDINVLEAGTDFECKASTIKTRVRSVAKKMGLKVRVGTNKDGDVIVQGFKPTAEEAEFAAAKAKAKTAAKAADKDEADDNDDGEPEAAPRRRRKAS